MPTIQFKQCAVRNEIASLMTGKQIYEDGIEATVSIDRRSNIVFQFPKRHQNESEIQFKARLPQEIQNYWMENLESYMKGMDFCNGTPLNSMTWLSAGQIETLRSAGIGSVEDLAKISEGVLEPFGLDGAGLRRQAKAWLDDKSGRAVAQIEQQSQRIAQLEEERKEAKDAIASMKEELELLKAAKKRK